jgi:2-oxo-4-hydroxy-4-carboxy-5-ureidoimidazoline decarboxylase
VGDPTGLQALNASSPAILAGELRACCAAESWIAAIISGRPYADGDALFAASDAATRTLDDAGLAQALAAHPRIGERPASAEAAWSRQEQAGMSSAGADIRERIADANQRYEQRFGHVYLVCATGLGSSELLKICLDRLGNDPITERTVVLGELAKIARLRLSRLLDPGTAK